MSRPAAIAERCERLRLAYELQGCAVSAELLPGLAPERLREATHWFPAPLPAELQELYAWRNGQLHDAWNTRHVFWFRDMQFSCVERVQAEYDSMMASYGVENEPARDGIDLATCFPFASFNGGWYVLPCAGQRLELRLPRPVVCVFQGIDVYFHSIASLLDTCTEWVLAADWSSGHKDIDEREAREIWQRHNPLAFQRRR